MKADVSNRILQATSILIANLVKVDETEAVPMSRVLAQDHIKEDAIARGKGTANEPQKEREELDTGEETFLEHWQL